MKGGWNGEQKMHETVDVLWAFVFILDITNWLKEQISKHHLSCWPLVYVLERKCMDQISSAHWEFASFTHSHLPSLWSAEAVTRPLEIQTKEKGRHLFELVCISAAQWVLVTDEREEILPKKHTGSRIRKWKAEREMQKERGSQSSGMLGLWLTTKLLTKSHPCQALALQPCSAMVPCQLKQWDQSEIAQCQI